MIPRTPHPSEIAAALQAEIDRLRAELAALQAQPAADVVVTKNEAGAIVAITRQDAEGRVVEVIAEGRPAADQRKCPSGAQCKHGSWCTDAYCQAECQFTKPAADALSFDEAWSRKVAAGYQYGEHELENVRMGFNMALEMIAEAQPAADAQAWQPIETAPKDRPILAWCDHEADPYYVPEIDDKAQPLFSLKPGGAKYLTTYAAHYEGMSHAPTGVHIIEWGGGFDDRSYEEPDGGHLPDWWFVAGSEFEVAANPTHWMPLPEPPAIAAAKEAP